MIPNSDTALPDESPDIWRLYRLMFRSRLFEEAVAKLWKEGEISGEMHLGTGEEGIVAGIVDHLIDGDAMALDHRGTPPLIMRGVDPALLLNEFLGKPEGLCRGRGGHMHLFSKEDLIASSGIVGASAPTAVGFALAARFLRPGTLAVAFFGDAAINQGMLMEAMNLAVVWNLPVVFVCKDDRWGITTRSEDTTGGNIRTRAIGLGLAYYEADGADVHSIWQTARKAINDVRNGGIPALLHASCVHLEGHFLGYQLLRAARNPLKEMPAMTGTLARSVLSRKGAAFKERISALKTVTDMVRTTRSDPREDRGRDPIHKTRSRLENDVTRLNELEAAVESEIVQCVSTVLRGAAS